MPVLRTLCCAALLCLGATANAATIYKWTDEQGHTHFGSQPPTDYTAEVLTTKPFNLPAPAVRQPSEPAAESPRQSDIDQQVRSQVAQQQAELRAYCTSLRTSLSQLNNNPRLFAEVNGKTVRLGEDERQQRIQQVREQISKNCENL